MSADSIVGLGVAVFYAIDLVYDYLFFDIDFVELSELVHLHRVR
jgi:hypothetical protein